MQKNCVFHCVHKEIDNAFSPSNISINKFKDTLIVFSHGCYFETNQYMHLLESVFEGAIVRVDLDIGHFIGRCIQSML